jgi:meso-butanediol dehydrogenase/(S,S)-butanediol dehydrogenase/diacetyl reductase
MRLIDKVAVVTGAGSGIGRAIAVAFAREGAHSILVGRTESKLEETAKETGGGPIVCVANVNRDVEKVRQLAEQRFGKLDILVNNAASLIAGTAESHTEAEWDETFDTNVKAPWLLIKALLPLLRAAGTENGGASIINISSVLGLVGAKNRVAYAASKGALTLMTKTIALDHAHEKIRCNCICPGIVETELVEKFITQAPDPEAVRKQRIGLHPLGRFGRPEDIAACAVFLASDEASWVTGAAFPVDGGFTAV